MNVEEIREFCLSLPHVTEDLKWGNNLCFLIGEKIFCLTDLDNDFAAVLKVREEDFEDLTAREGIKQASHFARRKWIVVTGEGVLSEVEWMNLLTRSYDLVRANLTKKIQDQFL